MSSRSRGLATLFAIIIVVVSFPPSIANSTKLPNLADDWVYGGSIGRAHVTQADNRVTLALTWTPNAAPGPHYKIDTVIKGNALDGTWHCVTPVCQGQNGKFHADINADASQLTITKTDDPGNTNEWNTFVLVRSPSNVAAMSKELHDAGRIELYDILFDTDKTVIKPESKPILDAVAALLKNDTSLKVEISGHTDNTGTAEHNMVLSKGRADAVVTALVGSYGIDGTRLQAKGYGDTRPVAPNDNERNRANNRRVELRKL